MKVSQSDLLHLFSAPRPSNDAGAIPNVVEEEPGAVPPPERTTPAAAPSPEIASEVMPTTVDRATTTEVPSSRVDTTFTALHREVATALPALWAKARNQKLTRSEERKKLRALLSWLASKKGLKSQESASMRYRQAGEFVEGKVDLMIRDTAGVALLAVEADWTLQEASLAKLKAAHDKGIPVMWILGTPAKAKQDAKEARKYAMKQLGREAGNWLVIFHLEHGWL
jgi:hypothetical protein